MQAQRCKLAAALIKTLSNHFGVKVVQTGLNAQTLELRLDGQNSTKGHRVALSFTRAQTQKTFANLVACKEILLWWLTGLAIRIWIFIVSKLRGFTNLETLDTFLGQMLQKVAETLVDKRLVALPFL